MKWVAAFLALVLAGCGGDDEFLAWPELPEDVKSVVVATADSPLRMESIELRAMERSEALGRLELTAGKRLELFAYRRSLTELALNPGILPVVANGRRLPFPDVTFVSEGVPAAFSNQVGKVLDLVLIESIDPRACVSRGGCYEAVTSECSIPCPQPREVEPPVAPLEPTPPSPPRLAGSCEAPWFVAPLPDGTEACRPPEGRRVFDCDRFHRLDGALGTCVPLDECDSARWRETSGTAIFVDSSATPPGDGSVGNPFVDLEAALTAAPADATVLLSAGTYSLGDWTATRPVRVLGKCVRETEITARMLRSESNLELAHLSLSGTSSATTLAPRNEGIVRAHEVSIVAERPFGASTGTLELESAHVIGSTDSRILNQGRLFAVDVTFEINGAAPALNIAGYAEFDRVVVRATNYALLIETHGHLVGREMVYVSALTGVSNSGIFEGDDVFISGATVGLVTDFAATATVTRLHVKDVKEGVRVWGDTSIRSAWLESVDMGVFTKKPSRVSMEQGVVFAGETGIFIIGEFVGSDLWVSGPMALGARDSVRATLRRVALEGDAGVLIRSTDAGARVHVEDLRVRSSRSFDTSSELELDVKLARAELEGRVQIIGAQIDISDLLVLNATDAMQLDQVQGSVVRLRIVEPRNSALLVEQSQLHVTDVDVLGGIVPESELSFAECGPIIDFTKGSSVETQRLKVRDFAGGVGVRIDESTIRASDVDVEGGELGVLVRESEEARIDRFRLSRLHGSGVRIRGSSTNAVFGNVEVSNVGRGRRNVCQDLIAAGNAFDLTGRAQATIDGLLVSHVESEGARFLDGAQLDMHDAKIIDTPLGFWIGSVPYDLRRVLIRTQLIDVARGFFLLDE